MIWLGVVLIIVCLLAGCVVVINSENVDVQEHLKGMEVSTDLKAEQQLSAEQKLTAETKGVKKHDNRR